MAIAISRHEEARAALGFVRSDQYPQFEVSAGANRGNSIPGTSVITPISNNFVLAGNLSYELDLWGKLRRSTEAARAELLATVDAGNSIMITLIADVASAYQIGRASCRERADSSLVAGTLKTQRHITTAVAG